MKNVSEKQYPAKVLNIDTGIAHDGRKKKERYRWADTDMLVSEPILLDLKDLNVDEYQRGEASKPSTTEKAKNFSFEAAGAPIVAKRNDGTFWIVDGLQRILAIVKRGDVEKIWCMVFRSRGKSHEAAVFFLCNIGRVNVEAIHKFNVAVAANYQPQAQIAEWLADNGFIVANHDSKHTIRFIAQVQQIWGISPESAKRALLFCREINYGYMDNMIFKGASLLVRRGIEIEAYAGKVKNMGGVPCVKQKINEIAILMGTSKSWYACGKGLLDIINHKVKAGNRLSLNLVD